MTTRVNSSDKWPRLWLGHGSGHWNVELPETVSWGWWELSWTLENEADLDTRWSSKDHLEERTAWTNAQSDKVDGILEHRKRQAVGLEWWHNEEKRQDYWARWGSGVRYLKVMLTHLAYPVDNS